MTQGYSLEVQELDRRGEFEQEVLLWDLDLDRVGAESAQRVGRRAKHETLVWSFEEVRPSVSMR